MTKEEQMRRKFKPRVDCVLFWIDRRKRTLALRGRNQRRVTSEWAGRSVSTAVSAAVFLFRHLFVPPMP